MPDASDKPLILDCQVHAYDRDHPARPWIGSLPGPPQVTGDDMVVAMSSVGVGGAILVSPWSMYRFDASYALEVHARHPGRFGLVKPFDPEATDVADQVGGGQARTVSSGAEAEPDGPGQEVGQGEEPGDEPQPDDVAVVWCRPVVVVLVVVLVGIVRYPISNASTTVGVSMVTWGTTEW